MADRQYVISDFFNPLPHLNGYDRVRGEVVELDEFEGITQLWVETHKLIPVPPDTPLLRHELTGRRFARAQDLHEYARLYERKPADAHPQSIYGVVYAAPPLGHPPPTTPVPTGRTLGSGLTYPDSDRFLALLQPAALAFRQERGRWPTRQEAIDSVTWPDHKPSLDIFKDRFTRAGLTYTQWLDTLKLHFP